jgi:hypothetical protein
MARRLSFLELISAALRTSLRRWKWYARKSNLKSNGVLN